MHWGSTRSGGTEDCRGGVEWASEGCRGTVRCGGGSGARRWEVSQVLAARKDGCRSGQKEAGGANGNELQGYAAGVWIGAAVAVAAAARRRRRCNSRQHRVQMSWMW
jgi:hypothetical protein